MNQLVVTHVHSVSSAFWMLQSAWALYTLSVLWARRRFLLFLCGCFSGRFAALTLALVLGPFFVR